MGLVLVSTLSMTLSSATVQTRNKACTSSTLLEGDSQVPTPASRLPLKPAKEGLTMSPTKKDSRCGSPLAKLLSPTDASRTRHARANRSFVYVSSSEKQNSPFKPDDDIQLVQTLKPFQLKVKESTFTQEAAMQSAAMQQAKALMTASVADGLPNDFSGSVIAKETPI